MKCIIQRKNSRLIYVNLSKNEEKLAEAEMMPTEEYHVHDRLKVLVTKVENTSKGPQIYISRSHPNLLKRLFEMEVPEIFDGIVEIKSIAREAVDRSKISVYEDDPEIDHDESCVGHRGD